MTATRPPEDRLSVPARAAVALVKAYQAVAAGRLSPCRFYPSCSNYAVEAFTVHGFWHGLGLTTRRLLRCRPFGSHGVDLVPLPVHVHTREGRRP
jgi:putative membrane protein insertion efficiency factor